MIDFGRAAVCISICLFSTNLSVLSRAANLQTVAFTGRPAPGTPGGIFQSFLSQLDLNEAGRVAFVADLGSSPPPGGGRMGLWSDAVGQLELVARSGAPAPDLPNPANFSDLRGSFALNNHGHIAFVTSLAPGSGLLNALYSNASGSLQLIALEGRPVPTSQLHTNFESFRQVHLDDFGRVVFVSELENSTLHIAAWRGDDQALSFLASTLTQAPGMPRGSAIHNRAPFNLLSNRSGQVAFSASVAPSPGNFQITGSGVWSDRSGQQLLIAKNGDNSPSGLPGETFIPGGLGGINDFGHMAYRVGFAGPGVTTSNNVGIVLQRHDAPVIVARLGDAAPGTEPGTVFTSILTAPTLNNSDQLVFAASLNSSQNTDTGLWLGAPENLKLVSRQGDPAPGVPNGVTFARWFRDSPPINDFGQVAFLANLQGPGITSANDLGIWATDRGGNLHLIAREGDAIEVAPNDYRVIRELNLRESGSDTFDHPKLNNRGQVAFHARFVDNSSGIFISNSVAIPEPASLCLVATLAVCSGFIRPRANLAPAES